MLKNIVKNRRVILEFKLTIGMPSYNNFSECYFTIQALRMYHSLENCEILVIDNFGDHELEKFIKNQGVGIVRYEKCIETNGPSYAKNKVFELAKGEMVLVIDSHVLLAPNALINLPISDDLYHGPLLYNDMKNYTCSWEPVWRSQMWGIWSNCSQVVPETLFDIWGMGCGCFMTSKKGWLGFNPKCKGFGGAEEGIIHEKYRKAGRRVICLPQLKWLHHFDRKIPHPVILMDRIVNYIINFNELELNLAPIKEHFGEKLFNEALIEASKR